MIRLSFKTTGNELECTVEQDGNSKIVKGLDAIKRLNTVSKNKYAISNISVLESENVVIRTKKAIIKIDNYKDILKYVENPERRATMLKQYKISELMNLLHGVIHTGALVTLMVVAGYKLYTNTSDSLTALKCFDAITESHMDGIENIPEVTEEYYDDLNDIKFEKESFSNKFTNGIAEVINLSNLEVSNNEYIDIKDSIQTLEYNSFDNDVETIDIGERYNISVDCEDKGESDDVRYVLENYGDMIEAVSRKYGVSPNLITAMVTQESHGIHKNLMQMEYEINKDEIFHSCDFSDKNMPTVSYVLTDNPEKYAYDVITISEEELYNNKMANLSICVVKFRGLLTKMNSNVPAALLAYNMGYERAKGYLQAYARECGKTYEQVLNDKENVDWIKGINFDCGDNKYVQDVLQYLNGEIVITNIKLGTDGTEEVIYNVNKTLDKTHDTDMAVVRR